MGAEHTTTDTAVPPSRAADSDLTLSNKRTNDAAGRDPQSSGTATPCWIGMLIM